MPVRFNQDKDTVLMPVKSEFLDRHYFFWTCPFYYKIGIFTDCQYIATRSDDLLTMGGYAK